MRGGSAALRGSEDKKRAARNGQPVFYFAALKIIKNGKSNAKIIYIVPPPPRRPE
jgi:hypothetical protein